MGCIPLKKIEKKNNRKGHYTKNSLTSQREKKSWESQKLFLMATEYKTSNKTIVPSYMPVEDFENPTEQSKKSIVEKFGHILLVEASVRLIITFLKRSLFYCSQNKEKVGPFSDWAKNNLTVLNQLQKNLEGFLENVTMNNKSSGFSLNVFHCEVRRTGEGENAKEFWYSKWYNGKFQVPSFFLKQHNLTYYGYIEKNNITLTQARTYELMNQLYFRIKIIQHSIEHNKTCEDDFHLEEESRDIFQSFVKLYEEAEPLLADLNKLQESRRIAHSQKGDHKTPPPAPKKPVAVSRITNNTKPKRIDWSILSTDQDDKKDEVQKKNDTTHTIPIPKQMSQTVQPNISFAEKVKATMINEVKSEDEKSSGKNVTGPKLTNKKLEDPYKEKKVEDAKVQPEVSSPKQKQIPKMEKKDMIQPVCDVSDAAELGTTYANNHSNNLGEMVLVSMMTLNESGQMIEKMVMVHRNQLAKMPIVSTFR